MSKKTCCIELSPDDHTDDADYHGDDDDDVLK